MVDRRTFKMELAVLRLPIFPSAKFLHLPHQIPAVPSITTHRGRVTANCITTDTPKWPTSRSSHHPLLHISPDTYKTRQDLSWRITNTHTLTIEILFHPHHPLYLVPQINLHQPNPGVEGTGVGGK